MQTEHLMLSKYLFLPVVSQNKNCRICFAESVDFSFSFGRKFQNIRFLFLGQHYFPWNCFQGGCQSSSLRGPLHLVRSPYNSADWKNDLVLAHGPNQRRYQRLCEGQSEFWVLLAMLAEFPIKTGLLLNLKWALFHPAWHRRAAPWRCYQPAATVTACMA